MHISFTLTLLLLLAIGGHTARAAESYTQKSQTQSLLSIGDAFVQSGNTVKAEQLYDEAFSIANSPEDKWDACDRLSQLLISTDRRKEALDHYYNLLGDEGVMDDERIKMNLHSSIGHTYHMMRDYVSAIHSFERAEKIMRAEGYNDFKPTLFNNIAKTLIEAGDVRRAKRLLDTAEVMTASVDDDQVVLTDIYRTKARLNAANDNHATAYHYMELYASRLAEMSKNEISEIINSTNPLNMQEKVEGSIRHDKYVAQLEEEVEAQKKSITHMKAAAYAAGIAVLLLFCIIIYFFTVLRRKNNDNNTLAKNNDDKHRIMSIMAHDIANPLNSLLGFSEFQVNYASAHNDPDLETASKHIYSSALTLNDIFQNIAIWNRMSTRTTQSTNEIINVGSAIEDVVETFRIAASDKGIHISVNIDEAVEVSTNNSHLAIMLRNVISNALKFTPRGGRITISGYTYRNKTNITVEDTGIGMDAETIEHIMHGETVTSHAGTEDEKGIGIGLSICKELMESNGGSMEIKSAPGEGTSITLEFNNK